jgi:hypothetical protein
LVEARRAAEQPLPLAHPVTGEITWVAFKNGRRQRWWNESFLVASQSARVWLAKQDLKKSTYKVYLLLEGVLDFENWIGITQADVGKELDIDAAAVSRAFKELEQIGVLERGAAAGRGHTWRLNPMYVWKGSPKRRLQVVAERDLMPEQGRLVPGAGAEQESGEAGGGR